MSILLFTAITTLLVVLAILFLFRPYDYGGEFRRLEKTAGHEPELADDTQWRSARIRPGLNCCDRVKSIEHQIFLAQEVPALPLVNCGETHCDCHYLFLDDRRCGLDRRAELARLKGILPNFDRRYSPGRRFGDLMPA